MNENGGFKPFFIRGFLIIIVVFVFLLIVATSVVGILSVVNNITPPELIWDYFKSGEQQAVKEADLKDEGLVKDETTIETETGTFLLEELDKAVNEVVKEINSSVVNILVTVKQRNIFGEEILSEGLGSGVIFSQDGYIITNNHVAGAAEDILVTLFDGSEYPAELIGADENTDIAVIKIEAENLNAASFVSTDTVEVGDIVIAVGSPFGLQQTVTMGVISAKGRDVNLSEETIPLVNLIQTDAAINSGNSGGPLVNSTGEVIGINTLILSPTGASTGIGLAIPSDTAVNITKQIRDFGRARIPYIGIEMGENDTDIAGVYISSVTEGYPAKEAGMLTGDIITEFDGVEVKNPYELFGRILRYNVGDIVDIEIYRNGDYLTITMELVESPLTQNNP
jgi:serine protease Do